jgi:ferrochelatase
MPKRYLINGDPYFCFCHKTARLVAERLELNKEDYTLAFQSRFGREEWLQPYIDDVIINTAKKGIRRLHVISPGFSVDCLETLEEIKIQYSKLFKDNGGQELVYIPCLNSGENHISMINNIIQENTKGW